MKAPRQRTTPLLRVLKYARCVHPLVRILCRRRHPAGLEKRLMGIRFAHPVGVSAGIDKNGELIDALSCFSPAFIEIGPLRNVRDTIQKLKKRRCSTIVLGNLSNSKDLVSAFTLLYDFVDGIVLNVSQGSSVSKVIDHLLELRRYNDTYKPIIFKLYPDLTADELENVVKYMLGSGIDGVMTNCDAIGLVREKTHGLLPIIAVCETPAPEQTAQTLDSGADLAALALSSFRHGPRLLYRTVKYLDKR